MAGNHRRAKDDQDSDLFDRWMSSRKRETAPAESVEATAAVRPVVSPVVGTSTDVEFAPRTATRRLVGWLLVGAVAGLAIAAALAYRDPTTLTVGVAATLAVLTLAIWAIRAASPTVHVSVRSGRLEVVQGGGRFVFELASGHSPFEVVGAPGDRNWKVLFLRRNMDPFVVDSSMVDPRAFMDMLRRYLPE